MKHHHLEIFFAGLLLSLSMPTEAHTGHGLAYDLQAGLRHPLLGIDHILAMVGVGLWAGFLGGAARGRLPAAFLAAMAAGASLAFAGMVLQGPEMWVAASVLAIGVILLGIPSKLFFLANNVGWGKRWVRRTENTVKFEGRRQSAPAATAPCVALPPASMQSNPSYVSARHGWASVLAALFAFGHGYVHALEAGTDSQAFSYAAGFLVSSALLLGVGLLIGRVSAARSCWIKSAFGAICAGAGMILLLGG
ncbi:HupE/UreJ family protein [Methylomicrobium sp. RS1]|uniref:HupE/UreJ family protein n=1 Tax=Candidatus Methylomicrobium oryzae TaxID=2802053 RepID=UPI00192312E6|nr:HupE/UreJ family protein [Methylomicrobium sp. RS1]MBL1263438.1 HupE/UreJ family protein [Methylomicrobium sp. RS1]